MLNGDVRARRAFGGLIVAVSAVALAGCGSYKSFRPLDETERAEVDSVRFASQVLALGEPPPRGDHVVDLAGAFVLPAVLFQLSWGWYPLVAAFALSFTNARLRGAIDDGVAVDQQPLLVGKPLHRPAVVLGELPG